MSTTIGIERVENHVRCTARCVSCHGRKCTAVDALDPSFQVKLLDRVHRAFIFPSTVCLHTHTRRQLQTERQLQFPRN
jgi:hypothetical protein